MQREVMGPQVDSQPHGEVEEFHFSDPQSRRYKKSYTVKKKHHIREFCVRYRNPITYHSTSGATRRTDMYLDAVLTMKIQGLVRWSLKNVAAEGRMMITVESTASLSCMARLLSLSWRPRERT